MTHMSWNHSGTAGPALGKDCRQLYSSRQSTRAIFLILGDNVPHRQKRLNMQYNKKNWKEDKKTSPSFGQLEVCFSLQRVLQSVFVLHKVNIKGHFAGSIKNPLDFRKVT